MRIAGTAPTVCEFTVVAFRNHVDCDASDAKFGHRSRSIRFSRSMSDPVGNSSNRSTTTGVVELIAATFASASSTKTSSETGELARNSARKTNGAGTRTVRNVRIARTRA